MKYFYILLMCILWQKSVFAQAGKDKIVKDCNKQAESIQTVLNSQKVLIIANMGLDCSICMGDASTLATYATSDTQNIRIWGALKYLYADITPTCNEIHEWINTYGWQSHIFSFISDNFWRDEYFDGNPVLPTFIVIDPLQENNVFKYYGNNAFQNAWEKADILAQVVKESKINYDDLIIQNNPFQNYISIKLPVNVTAMRIRLIEYSGKTVFEKDLSETEKDLTIVIHNLTPSLYILEARGDNFKKSKRIFKY